MKKFLFVPLTSVFLVLALLFNVVLLNAAPGSVLLSAGVNGAENGNTSAEGADLSSSSVQTATLTAESTVSKNASSGNTETQYAHGTTVKTDSSGNKVFTFTYNGETYESEFDRLMAEDGFIYGIDWDWFGTWTTQVNALGDDNQVFGVKSRYRPAYVERALYNMHAMGNNAMGTWLGPKSCFEYDLTTGHVIGLDAKFRENLINLLESCRKTGMDLVPALLSHGDGAGYQNETALDKDSAEMHDFFIRFYYDEEAQDAYFKNWVEPVCEILAQYQDVIPIVALTIENGDQINDIETGQMHKQRGFTWDEFATLNNRLHDTVKKYMPNVLTSVEDVGNPTYMYKYNDLKVDIISPQKYEADGIFPDNAQWMKTRAGYLGEFNYAHDGGYMDISLDALDIIMQRYYKDARQKGYLGAFHFIWSYQDPSRWSYFTTGNSDKYESLRNFAVPVSYIINDLKHEHRGTTGKDVPSLFYNNESTNTYWIGCRNAESYILERSDNGGDWKVIAKDINPIDNSLTNGLVCYEDSTLPTTGDYRYRVAAVYEDGEKVYSEAGNVTRRYIPVEKLLDSSGTYIGSFEKGPSLLSNEQANLDFTENYDVFKYLSNGKLGSIIEGGRTGDYCLYGNTADGTSVTAGYGAQWVFNINVTPNADHELSFYVKQGSTGKICFAIRPIVDGKHLDQVGYIHSTLGQEETEEEWVNNFVTFTAPDSGQISVYARVSGDGEFWIDDLSVKEIR